MSDTPDQESELNDDDALKRRLLNRIAIAAVMVLGLLGSLAMFDVLMAPPPPPAKVAVLPAPETPKPAEPVAPTTEAPKDAGAAAGSEPTTTEGQTALPSALPPGTQANAQTAAPDNQSAAIPETTTGSGAPPLQPLPPEKPLTKPATSRQASIRPSEPVAPASSPAARPDPGRELTRSPATTQQAPQAARRAPASRPITQATERRFGLQLGVFNNVANAEDLRAQLELNGIPSTIEARVHAGPFASREEAESARAKLKELGLDGGLLITMKK